PFSQKQRNTMKRLFATILATILLISPVLADEHRAEDITFLASGVKTGTAQSTGFNIEEYIEGQILVDVTAESGTSTLDITIETSADNSTWFTHTTLTQISATGRVRQAITNFGKYVRINYTVGGTSFTFSVVGVFKN
ncbi:MAG TPA: hypothetical protein PKL48_02560, partial [Thermodesulfobacteriota bacterium]|nr:hypothetical protein [Thermodesulfobacteriota bacterium]